MTHPCLTVLAHPAPGKISPENLRREGEAKRRHRKGLVPLGVYMMGCAVLIVGDVRDEQSSRYSRAPIGTGFIVCVESERVPGSEYGYLLTAHHVIEDESGLELLIPRVDDPMQHYPIIDAPDFDHPVERLDLAIAPFDIPPGYSPTALRLGFNLPPPGEMKLESLLGTTFHYVGYLEPLKLVMARSGTIGRVDEMLPDGDYNYRTHVGDVRSYGGFSGSPCFAEYAVPVLKEQKMAMRSDTDDPVGRLTYLHLLCGMFTGHLDNASKRVAGQLASRHGVGFILSSDEIWNALMSDEMRADRRRRDALGGPEDVRTRTSVKTDNNDELDNFEDLTTKLLRVPKSELDEELKKS